MQTPSVTRCVIAGPSLDSMMSDTPSCFRIFTRFLIYNYVFFGMQLAYIFTRGGSFIHTIHLPGLVYFELILTLFIHLSLYLLLSIAETLLLWGVRKRLSVPFSSERWPIIIWSLCVFALIITNAYFFPLRAFGLLFLSQWPHTILLIGVWCAAIPLGLLTLNALFFLTITHPKVVTLGTLFIAGCFFYAQKRPADPVHTSSKPHIIIIGVDSLALTAMNPETTPKMLDFIKDSVLFKETISPLARTFPAWSSILTGLYPEHHHAHYNLMPPGQTKSSKSIAWNLQKSGYQTIFATDDRRFNAIDKTFGFQEVIGPKLGVNDIILGSFNDFPLSNLLINAPLSRVLFPYNYMNRASFFSYYPHTFDKALQHRLTSRPNTAPLFLAVHFTLPHWPYAYAASKPAVVKDTFSVTERGQLFSEALIQADQQVAHLLQTLQKNGYLENSLIVLLSDHGETFYTPGSRQTEMRTYQRKGPPLFADYLKRKTSTALEQSAGHGSDLLSAEQYHCLLAFKIYQHGLLATQPNTVKTRVSLIDITPTLQNFLRLPDSPTRDGISLLGSIQSKHASLPERSFIMESGMLPNQFLSQETARLSAKKYFMVSQTSRQLHLRNSKLHSLDKMKLYGIIEGDWVLAMYPDDDGYIPVIQRLSDGAWDDTLDGSFAHSSPALKMLSKMEQFYNSNWIAKIIPVKRRTTMVKNNGLNTGIIKNI